MRRSAMGRPFDDFRTAITDPPFFCGRQNMLKELSAGWCNVNIVLGGRRIGKTSVLRSVEWNMLDSSKGEGRAFPVFLPLDVEQPSSLDNLRYILIRRLQDSLEKWSKVKGRTIRKLYRSFRSQVASGEVSLMSLLKLKIRNPDAERKLGNDDFRESFLRSLEVVRKAGFDGVVFLMDEAEFVVRSSWANDAWSYLRGIKNSDDAVKSFLGLTISGYRDVKEYQQRVGSPLFNIGRVRWISNLSYDEVVALCEIRSLNEERFGLVQPEVLWEWSGGHPFLAQQLANYFLDHWKGGQEAKGIVAMLLRSSEISGTFSSWWNEQAKSDGFGEVERLIYQELNRTGSMRAGVLARKCKISPNSCLDALEVLAGTGVVREDSTGEFKIAGELFRQWVEGNRIPSTSLV